jgi:2-keto-4-pentenoate hydratase/2-oxohepta-3-ene-1,7-dioic acid hydratase in catechol pathway
MRIVTFGPKKRVGLLHDDRVMDVHNAVRTYLTKKLGPEGAAAKAASAAPPDLCGFIEAGAEALELAGASLAQLGHSTDSSIFLPLASAGIGAPWPGRRIACAGANFAEHIQRFMVNMGQPPVTREQVESDWRSAGLQGFWKVSHEAIGDGGDVIYPARTTRLDFEAEVAVVIGKKGKDISIADAPGYIWGTTLFNDWSDRDALRPLKIPVSFNFSKNFDCCTSLGPCICVRGVDPQDVSVSLSVNGEVRQSFSTRDMMFSFAELIAEISRDLTLVPGDIIAGGTGAGTAMDSSKYDSNRRLLPDLFLKVGDAVEISAPSIGVLRNHIVAKA